MPVLNAKIKILTNRKRYCSNDDQIEKECIMRASRLSLCRWKRLHVPSWLQSAHLITSYSKQQTIRKISMLVWSTRQKQKDEA